MGKTFYLLAVQGGVDHLLKDIIKPKMSGIMQQNRSIEDKKRMMLCSGLILMRERY